MKHSGSYFRWFTLVLAMLAAVTTANTAVTETSPEPPDAGRAGPQEPLPGPRIRLDFRDASVLQVIRLLSQLTGANIMASEQAGSRTLSVFLHEIPLHVALEAICKTAGLWYRRDDSSNLWRIMTLDEYQRDIVVYREEKTRIFTLRNANVVSGANAVVALFGARVKLTAGTEEGTSAAGASAGGESAGTAASASVAASSASATGRTDALTANQIDATLKYLQQNPPASQVNATGVKAASATAANSMAELEARLADSLIAPPPVFVTYNRLHNLLIVRSSDLDALSEIEQLVQEMDRPTRQVLLEMKVLEVTLGDSFRSVFDISLTGGSAGSGPKVNQPANPLIPSASEGPRLALGSGNFPLEGGTLLFQMMNDRVLSRLQLLASENKVNALSSPVLLASNNQPARLFVGEERVITTGVTSNTITTQTQAVTTFAAQTEKREVGNTLEILPRINADGTVTLAITQDSSSILAKSATLPVGNAGSIQEFPIDTVNTSNLKVTIVAKNRQSVAVGGMINERQSDAEIKVPLLGDIPWLGNLFKRKVKESARTEMVLLVTPYIVETPEDGADQSRTALGDRITHPQSRLALPVTATATP